MSVPIPGHVVNSAIHAMFEHNMDTMATFSVLEKDDQKNASTYHYFIN